MPFCTYGFHLFGHLFELKVLRGVPAEATSSAELAPTCQATVPVSSGRPSEAFHAKFLRPKSQIDDRRKTVTMARSATEAPVIPYVGSCSGPISLPPVHEPKRPVSNPIGSSRFFFPLASLKSVRSETDLTKKGAASPLGPSTSDSSSLLNVVDSAESKSRRWSMSGRRDKSPTVPSTSAEAIPPKASKEPRNGLSFRRKN